MPTDRRTPLVYCLDRNGRGMAAFATHAGELVHPDERECLRDMYHSGMRDRYAVSRAVLRLLLSTRARRQHGTDLFAKGCFGRPLPIPLDDGSTLLFSVSHSGSLSCFAFMPELHGGSVGLGIDVEVGRTVRHPLSTADFSFSPIERAYLRNADAGLRNSLFLRLWTRKEAVVKCCGGSVAKDMDRFSVPLDNLRGRWAIRPEGFHLDEDLRLSDIDIGPGVHAALCWQGNPTAIQPFHLKKEHLDELRSFSER